MKDTYKKHKRIIQQIKSGTYPKQIECENWEESDILNYLIDNGHLKGIRDQWGLVIDDISTTETTNKYLEEINSELRKRNILFKFYLEHWKILLPIIISIIGILVTAIVALFIHFDSKPISHPDIKKNDTQENIQTEVHIITPPNPNYCDARTNNTTLEQAKLSKILLKTILGK